MTHVRCIIVTAALLAATLPTRAYACGGPCTTPELWGVLPLNETPLVVTNFGLLSPVQDRWQLTCEEVIGGILLGVESNDTQAIVSTEVGLFVAGQDLCGFGQGPTSERSAWFLDFAVAADSTVDSPHLIGIASDPKASVINVELATGDTFEVLHNLGSETAYRHVEASPDFSSIVVAGYASQPRRWQLAWSADAGDSWQEFTPDIDAPSASVLLLGIDPKNADRVFFQLQATDDSPAELWTFARSSAEAEQQFVLPAGQAITGLAFLADEVWLTSRGPSAGGLYHATLEDVAAFEPLLGDVPPLACLGVVAGEAFVCLDDYSSDSPFLLGKVNVEAKAFEPLLALSDLGKLDDCGSACASTQAWLDSVYGDPSDTGSDTSSGADTSAPPDPPPEGEDEGGCSIRRGAIDDSELAAPLAVTLLGLLALSRRRRVVT